MEFIGEMGKIDVDDATQDYPVITEYFAKKGIHIKIDGMHPTGEDCIFDKHTGKWLGYTSMYCYDHNEMQCDLCFSSMENYEKYIEQNVA